MHRESASGSIHEPKPIHLNDVFLAFDVDGDGYVSAEDEHNNEEGKYNQATQEQCSW